MGLRIYDSSWFIHYGARAVKTKNYVFAGYPLGGVKFLVSNILSELLAMHDIVCCFDSPTYKYDLMPEYKGNRPHEAYISNQAEYAYSMLMKTGVSCFKVVGEEGDSLIASLVAKYRDSVSDIICYSNDADIAHNVARNVKVQAVCAGGIDITANNFTAAVQPGDAVEFNTISAYKVLVKDRSDNILQFRSETGLTGREIYNKYVMWGHENLPADERRPYLFSSSKIFEHFLKSLNLTPADYDQLNRRIKVVFPNILDDTVTPSNQSNVIRHNLAKLLTILSDDVFLTRFKLNRERLSDEEFNEFRNNAQVLRDGTYAADNDLPVHTSFIAADADINMRLFE